MSKSLEDLIDEDYERLDQEVYEMEELGLSNYGDRSYYIRNRDEYEKDKTIADLEAKLAESEKEKQEYLIKYKHWRTECAKLEEQLNNSEQKCLICSKDQENEQLKQQLAEKEEKLYQANSRANELECNLELLNRCLIKNEEIINANNQDKISFAVDILEELADCSNYINSKLDFECGSYVSEKAIRDKIKYLKGNEDE